MPNNSKIFTLRFQRQQHPFHIVNKSPWPFFVSLSALSVTTGAVLYMHRYQGGGSLLFWGIIFLISILWFWFRDIVIEGTFEGHHTKKVQAGLRLGMKLFITTEIMFFFSFFWAFFHSALSPHAFIGVMWPPKGIIPFYRPIIEPSTLSDNDFTAVLSFFSTLTKDWDNAIDIITQSTVFAPDLTREKLQWTQIKSCQNMITNDDGFRWTYNYLPLFNPYSIPLAATFILLSSGLTLHIAGMWFNYANKPTLWPFNNTLRTKLIQYNYHKIIESSFTPSRSAAYYAIIFWLTLTIVLGCIFTGIQAYEYIVLLPFSINDSVFGSCFYMLTGFHGFHVILGTVGLIICLYRHIKCHFTKTVHVGFECAAWYWHFVDGVWLFVYSIIYWWSAPLPKPYLWINEQQKLLTCGKHAYAYEKVLTDLSKDSTTPVITFENNLTILKYLTPDDVVSTLLTFA